MGHWNKRIDEATVKRIWKLREEGISWAQIMERFNISKWLKDRIRRGWTGYKKNA